MEQAQEIIKDLPKGLLQWYNFKPDSRILYTGSREDAIAQMLSEYSASVICASCAQTCDSGWQREQNPEAQNIFDYIISVESLEREQEPESILSVWKKLLKPDGRLLLGMNNRFGLKYFCGDRDPYTERNFDGVEDYRRAYSKKEDEFQGRCYSQHELERMLTDAGWQSPSFFSVLSDLANPCLIYAQDYLPNEDLATRVFPTYHYPDTVFLEEASLYDGLMKNGMFHKMANSYLIECAPEGEGCGVLHVTGSLERGREDALYTVIHKSGIVEKRAAYPEGRERLSKLAAHGQDLAAHGISVVDVRLKGESCVMPYIQAEVGQVYLKRLLQMDTEQFLQKMDEFRDLILQSSDIVEPDRGDGEGVILRRGYLDMVPLNSFYMDGTFVFYDQEFCEGNYPANAIITRMIATFYAGNMEFEKILPINTLFERYGLIKHLERWRKMEWDFLGKLRKEEELRKYHNLMRADMDAVNSNRQRMNYSSERYQKLFVDIFDNADSRKLILFGSGGFAKKFLALYGKDYPVYAVIDNNSEKWGQEIEGIRIQPPSVLQELQSGEYKIIICIKNFLSVTKQLDLLGVDDYSIYDWNKSYQRKCQKVIISKDMSDAAGKKYHIGYVAGVFDMFHVGHINLLRKAKEMCDYLIVGVMSDEGVYQKKKKYPIISCEDRCEVIRACRYADEVAELPVGYDSIRDAYRRFHFDCQFSGDDHGENTDWQIEKLFLKKNGADIVFFPYTEKVSSTSIREQLQGKGNGNTKE